MKLIIKDFQALKDVRLDIKGLTLLVGESGQGKSSVCRSLQAALFNRYKTGQVRFGQDHSVVKVKFEDSDEVFTSVRSWAGGSPLIQLGDKKYSKLGRTLPKEVSTFINFGNLDIGGELYNCNIHPQFQNPLLLEFSQQKVMELLSASSALDDLKEAKELILEERSKVKGAIQTVDQIRESLTTQLKTITSKIETLKPVVEEIVEVSKDFDSVSEQLKKIQSLQELQVSLEKDSFYEKLLVDFISVVYGLQSTNELYTYTQSLSKKLKELESLNDVESTLTSTIPTIKDMLCLDKAHTLASLISTLKTIENEEVSLSDKLELLKSISYTVTELGKISNKESTLRMLRVINKNLESLTEEEANYANFVENNICPICHNKVK